MKLNNKEFKNVIDKTTLFAFDFIVSYKKKILLLKRKNSPAKNYWFVPGGRVYKNEKMNFAIKRILKNELNVSKKNIHSFKKGSLYEHIYKKDNLFEDQDLDTHYIVQTIIIELKNINNIKIDVQSSKFGFFLSSEIKKSKNIHQFVKSYFITNSKNKLNFKDAKQ